jgi:hypothetical protein
MNIKKKSANYLFLSLFILSHTAIQSEFLVKLVSLYCIYESSINSLNNYFFDNYGDRAIDKYITEKYKLNALAKIIACITTEVSAMIVWKNYDSKSFYSYSDHRNFRSENEKSKSENEKSKSENKIINYTNTFCKKMGYDKKKAILGLKSEIQLKKIVPILTISQEIVKNSFSKTIVKISEKPIEQLSEKLIGKRYFFTTALSMFFLSCVSQISDNLMKNIIYRTSANN